MPFNFDYMWTISSETAHSERRQRSSPPTAAAPSTASPRERPSEEADPASVQEDPSGGVKLSGAGDTATLHQPIDDSNVQLCPDNDAGFAAASTLYQDQSQSDYGLEPRADSGPSGDTFNRDENLPDIANSGSLVAECNPSTHRVEGSLQDGSRPLDCESAVEDEMTGGSSEYRGVSIHE